MIFCVPLETTLMLSSFAMCAAKLPMLGPWIDSGASMCGKKCIALRHFFPFLFLLVTFGVSLSFVSLSKHSPLCTFFPFFFVSFDLFWSFFVFCVSF
jgi:hypothetical protein